jgi:enolase
MSQIKSIKAREILDSRGNPTVEVEMKTDQGLFLSSVPSGVSTGSYEAVEIRDGGERYRGKGVLRAVKSVNEVVAPKVEGLDATEQKNIDKILIELDGTKDKSNLGANAICGVSLAACRAGAGAKNLDLFKYIGEIFSNSEGYKLPKPLFNVINGGAHAGNDLDVQEFMISPEAESFSESLRKGVEIYHRLKELLSYRYGKIATNLGDEGGFAPPIALSELALDIIVSAASDMNYEKSTSIFLDVAASQFFEGNKYRMKTGVFTGEGLLRYYEGLIAKYPIKGLEDPFQEDDWEGFAKITSQFQDKLIIGDDLLVTNKERMKKAKKMNAVNSVIIKINQVGTVTEAIEAAQLVKEYGWKAVVSHRSGETNDDFIADFAVGINADFIKTGAPSRGERLAKYNRLLKIGEII